MSRHPEKWPTMGGRRGRGGRRADLGNQYFRSSWEANWARYLNWLIERKEVVRWEFEVDTFEFPIKRGSRFYTPDFKVYYPDGTFAYHEVKGYMDQRSRTKLNRMRIHHPKVSLRLIDKGVYWQVAATMSFLPHWEAK